MSLTLKKVSMFLLRGLVVACLAGTMLTLSALAAQPSLYSRPMQWTDDSGKLVSLDQWKGHKAIITMAYSTCRRTCSLTFKQLEKFQAEADASKQAVEIFIVSYDPKNDTPQTWADYRRQRNLKRSNWHFLTGNERDTKQLSRLLGLADFWAYDDHILHDFKISILDGSGMIVRQVAWADLQIRDVL